MNGRRKVVILGGGMAGLAAAWELSTGSWQDRYESITVYQRGWRLGGKGASSRGPHGRIEEHGLHILLGYYHDTFRVMRACYDELDRPRTDPDCPIATWDDAVSPSGLVGLVDDTADGWRPWVTNFTVRQGSPGGETAGGPLSLVDVVRRSLALLLDFHRRDARPPAVLSSSPQTPGPADFRDVESALRAAGLTTLAAALELVDQVGDAAGALASRARLARSLDAALGGLRSVLYRRIAGEPHARRTWELVDLVFTNLRGMVVDGLLTRPEGLRSIDHLDYRAWLRLHGAGDATVDQAIVRGMYDLVFAYDHGDPDRPRFSAGLGLELATRMLLGHEGALFWRMQAGMGEIVFAPLYEVLKRRGVDFRFFHQVDALRVGTDGVSIGAVEISRQVDVAAGPDAYDPLIDVDGLPCWPDRADGDQIIDGGRVGTTNLESLWAEWDAAGSVELVAGRDFDEVVFAISLGMVPYVAQDLMAASVRWRDMVEHVATVGTQSFQLWLNVTESDLGWRGPAGVTLSGFTEPFDTWASMGHLLARERWPADDEPVTLAYFCNVLGADITDGVAARHAHEQVRSAVVDFLDRDVAGIWPDAVDDDGFRWETLAGAGDAAGPDRLDAQYVRANVDPSDRYVQSLPGTDRYRLRPDDSGFRNLTLAGDWTDCGLNAGCVEAATRSGLLAARAVAGRRGDDTEAEAGT